MDFNKQNNLYVNDYVVNSYWNKWSKWYNNRGNVIRIIICQKVLFVLIFSIWIAFMNNYVVLRYNNKGDKLEKNK